MAGGLTAKRRLTEVFKMISIGLESSACPGLVKSGSVEFVEIISGSIGSRV